MAYKHYNEQTFTAERPGGWDLELYCSAQNTRYGFRHVCDFVHPVTGEWIRAKRCYYNRTWEQFRYESVLLEAARKLPEEYADAVREMCREIAEREHQKAEADFKAFKTAYDKCPAGVKSALSNVTIETEQDADFVSGFVKAVALLTGGEK